MTNKTIQLLIINNSDAFENQINEESAYSEFGQEVISDMENKVIRIIYMFLVFY